MAKIEYTVLQGIDYPPNKRAEAGQVVSDLPKDSIPWLLESGIIERTGATKKVAFDPEATDGDGDGLVQDATSMERKITTKPVPIVKEEVEDEL